MRSIVVAVLCLLASCVAGTTFNKVRIGRDTDSTCYPGNKFLIMMELEVWVIVNGVSTNVALDPDPNVALDTDPTITDSESSGAQVSWSNALDGNIDIKYGDQAHGTGGDSENYFTIDLGADYDYANLQAVRQIHYKAGQNGCGYQMMDDAVVDIYSDTTKIATAGGSSNLFTDGTSKDYYYVIYEFDYSDTSGGTCSAAVCSSDISINSDYEFATSQTSQTSQYNVAYIQAQTIDDCVDGDQNGDGGVNVQDVLALINYIISS